MTTNQVLYDADSDMPLGPATPEQVRASDESEARGQNGIFLIDQDGRPVDENSHDARRFGVRRVYTY